MTVFKYSMKLFWENRFTILIFFAIFVTISIWNTPRDKGVVFEEVKSKIGIIDYSKSDLSKGLVENLSRKNIVEEYKEKSREENAIREALFYGIYEEVVVIPEDFEERVRKGEEAVKLFVSSQDQEGGFRVQNAISSYIGLLKMTEKDGDYDFAAIEKLFQEEDAPTVIGKDAKTFSLDRWTLMYFTTFSYVILISIINVVGMVSSDFYEENIAKRNAISGIKSYVFNFNFFLSQLILVGFLMLITLLIPVFMQGKEVINGKFIAYFLNACLYAVSTLALVFLINKISTNKTFVSGFANVYSLATSFLCGVFVPREFLDEGISQFSKFLPTHYYVDSLSKISQGTFPQREILAILAFTFFFIVLGVYISSTKRMEGV